MAIIIVIVTVIGNTFIIRPTNIVIPFQWAYKSHRIQATNLLMALINFPNTTHIYSKPNADGFPLQPLFTSFHSFFESQSLCQAADHS
jgi:hypothetical protein